jgi:predicted transcriptional regulator
MSDRMREAKIPVRISVRLTPTLASKLKKEVSSRRKTESTVVREALETYFEREASTESCYDAFVRLGLAGSAKGLPRDLSTNKKYYKGFGK